MGLSCLSMIIGFLEHAKIANPRQFILKMSVEKSELKLDSKKKRIIHSTELFQGCREVIIEHANDFYRLLVTKAGKLILNK